jgi:hypothetical protein
MKRYTGQQALYEAISRSRAKAKRGNILERLLPEVSKQETPAPPEGPSQVEPTGAPSETPAPATKELPRPSVLKDRLREPTVVRENAKLRRLARVDAPPEKPAAPAAKPWSLGRLVRPAGPSEPVPKWWRLKPLQLNAGRIEVSVPYHIGIAVALAVVLVVLGAFRLGQKFPRAVPQNAATENVAAGGASTQLADNWIVLAQYKNAADLREIENYFAKNGIDLSVYELASTRRQFVERGLDASVLPSGDGYLLVTASLYGDPLSPGTDGYRMKQRIVDVGKKYKTLKGKEAFAPAFENAYGMRITRVGQ